ncbi:phage/plasmid primase, P4 family [Sphingomonas colocasiae]|nr:phage/plasmid primase, P4 family [Sphingomonas colocasiae]
MCSAALRYARHGWPVFPCRERDETVRLANGNERTYKAKSPYTGAGFKDATTDEARIREWWRRHPNALIGLATGRNGCFVLDFDPRHDAVTGEVFTLEQLKADLEEQMGCALPPSLTAITQSEGVHVYLRQPDGEPIRNRGNLPRHVDVRGEGGYVIAPPSVTYHDDGTEKGRYRWYRGKLGDEAVDAPAALIEILRSTAKRARAAAPAETDAAEPSTRSAPPVNRSDDPADVVRRRYALRALEDECAELEKTPEGGGRHGGRNRGIYFAALKLGGFVAGGWLSESVVRAALRDVIRNMPNNQDPDGAEQTMENGLRDGMQNAHDLSDVGTRAGARPSSAQANGSSRAGRPAAASSSAPGLPDRSSPPPPDDDGRNGQSSHAGGNGGDGSELGCGPGKDGGWGDDLTLRCAFMPQTDLGNLERFLARYGANFLFVEAWGWLAWDGQRWNRDMAVPMIGRAVQETMRLVQDEADLVRASGVPFPPKDGDVELNDDDDDGEPHPDDNVDERDPHFIREFRKQRRKLKSHMWYRQRLLARETGGEGPRHNAIVQVKSNGDIVLLSDKVAAWGRASESAGHISCIPTMAQSRLSARTEDFDVDPLALNVQNGTLQFFRPVDGAAAHVELRAHQRKDRITKIARASFDPAAISKVFDTFLERVQPGADMRTFLDCWAGYNAIGLADAQRMAIFYGEGSNGKGVWVQTIAWLLGDYAWATGIETFMGGGPKRTGGGPTTDLAALAGRRMVYANEPDDSSKFSDGLLKALTSDEPIGGVRELNRPPFELLVTWANTIMANTLPRIGTDWGTRRRAQVVPWDVIIPKEERDIQLKNKIKAEMSGVLNRVVAGALAYLTDGLPMPDAMVEATQQYHEENDMLGMFLDLCIARSPGDKLGATALHRLFEAWQTWAQQLPASGKAWSAKYLNAQMQKKGFKINKASTMQWHDIVPRFVETDFTDHDGKPQARELPAPKHPDKPSAGLPPGAAPPPQFDPPAPDTGRYSDDDLPP